MKLETTHCDKCKKAGAKPFSIFKDRKADGAGSMENWYYQFDLCAECCAIVLQQFFEKQQLFYDAHSMVKQFGVEMRVL